MNTMGSMSSPTLKKSLYPLALTLYRATLMSKDTTVSFSQLV